MLATQPQTARPGSVNSGKTLVLGLGNDLLSDDAVGLVIARAVRARFAVENRIDVTETAEMGLSLLDFMVGYWRVVVIDAVQTRRTPSGFLHELDETDVKVVPGMSPHFLGIGEIVALGRELGLAMPHRMKILGVEVADPFTMGTSLTPELAAALPELTAKIESVVREFACLTGGPA